MPLLVAVLFVSVLRILEGEAAHLRYHDIMAAFRAVPVQQLALALLCTLFAYAALPGYDAVALAYAGHRLPLRRIAYGSVITYGISQTLGFPALTGGSLRVRLWSAWGLETPEIARAAAFAGATFTFGVVLLTGIAALCRAVVDARAVAPGGTPGARPRGVGAGARAGLRRVEPVEAWRHGAPRAGGDRDPRPASGGRAGGRGDDRLARSRRSSSTCSCRPAMA